jgi:hypothetical protein
MLSLVLIVREFKGTCLLGAGLSREPTLATNPNQREWGVTNSLVHLMVCSRQHTGEISTNRAQDG